MSRRGLGRTQGWMLNEIHAAGGWVDILGEVCGSNYGGIKKHTSMVETLKSRHLVETRVENGILQARATDRAGEFV